MMRIQCTRMFVKFMVSYNNEHLQTECRAWVDHWRACTTIPNATLTTITLDQPTHNGHHQHNQLPQQLQQHQEKDRVSVMAIPSMELVDDRLRVGDAQSSK